MEAIWVAAKMWARGACAHSTIALEALGVVEHESGHEDPGVHQHA